MLCSVVLCYVCFVVIACDVLLLRVMCCVLGWHAVCCVVLACGYVMCYSMFFQSHVKTSTTQTKQHDATHASAHVHSSVCSTRLCLGGVRVRVPPADMMGALGAQPTSSQLGAAPGSATCCPGPAAFVKHFADP